MDSEHSGADFGSQDEAALDGRGEAGDLRSDDDAKCLGCTGCAALRGKCEHGGGEIHAMRLR